MQHRSGSTRWQGIWRGYVRALEALVATLLLAAIAVTFTNVVLRSLGFGSFAWADETSRRFLVWLTFIGSALAVVRSSHLRIDAIIEAAGPRMKRTLQVIVGSISIGFFLLLVIEGGRFAMSTMDRVTPGMSISTLWTTGIFPVGGMLLLVSFFGRLHFGAPAAPIEAEDREPGDDQAIGKAVRGDGGN